MINKKLINTLAAALAAAFTLSSCGGESTSQGSTVLTSQTTQTPVTTGETAAQTEESVTRNKNTVVFSHEGGFYSEEFKLTLEGAGAIYYTTDGSDPAASQTRKEYTEAITISDPVDGKNVLSAIEPSLFDAAHENVNQSGDGFDNYLSPPSDSDVDKITVIRAAAKSLDGTYSLTGTATYIVGEMTDHISGISEAVSAAENDLAVVSITMDYDDLFDYETGIYVKGKLYDEALPLLFKTEENIDGEKSRRVNANYSQKGREWERTAHVELFEANGTAARLVLSQDSGIRIQGNYSRSDLQKGFRLIARNDYGDNNFRYAVFGGEHTNAAGETMDKFKNLVLRAGGNTAFTSKFNDTYWQALAGGLAVDTQASRPCVVYLNGEYWGVYVLQEDYSDDYFEETYGVDKNNVIVYKGDAESLSLGYKLDEGTLPEGEHESFYYQELLNFFASHADIKDDAARDEFLRLVDKDSLMDYYSVQLFINNKWDWPGKNWSMWKTSVVDETNPYADGKWRFMLYDLDFGGVMGKSEARANTIKDSNYQRLGLLDMNTDNPSVLCFAYMMTNDGLRAEFSQRLLDLPQTAMEKEKALALLDKFRDSYSPLFKQFFARFPGTGTADEAIYGGYATYKTISDFLSERENNIQSMLDWAEKQLS